MPRPAPVQMKHCIVVAFEKVMHLHSIYAVVQDDDKRVVVSLLVDVRNDTSAVTAMDAESTLDALFPNATFQFRKLTVQQHHTAEVIASKAGLQKEFKVY